MCRLQGCKGYMARRMVVARTTAAEIAARWCARKVRGEDRELGTREGFLSDRVWVDFRNDAQRGDLKKRQAPKGISLFLSSMHAKWAQIWRGRKEISV